MNIRNTHLAFLFLVIIFAASCKTENPRLLVETELGNFTVELYADKAPETTANFRRYVEEHRLDGACFYRTVTLANQPDDEVKIQVIQGGLFNDDHPQALPPIVHESTLQTGILHEDGTLSMARNQPGTATSEFFICIDDQPSLDAGGNRNPDGQGFAAFGKVVKGMDVVRKIHRSPANGQWLEPQIKIISIRYRNR